MKTQTRKRKKANLVTRNYRQCCLPAQKYKGSRLHYLLSYLTFFLLLEKENVHTVDENYKFMYAINNQFPGPTVVVYENQTVSKCSVSNILILVLIKLPIAMF